MHSLHAGIIDAADDSRKMLAALCAERGWKPVSFESVSAFAAAAREKDPQLLLFALPEGRPQSELESDLSLLRSWKESRRETQLVLLLASDGPAADRLALILGARHILHKPFHVEDISQILATVAQGIGRRTRKSTIEKRASQHAGFGEIIGESERMIRVIDLARKVAAGDSTSIMVTGECGTGKGALAKAIHLASPRRDGPFIDVNCAAIPRNLLESEFFGHEAGAFTDAKEEKMGLFECAHGGTIFLDEVGEIDYPLQAKLLKFLDARVIWRVGGTRFLPVDVRVISATNRDLKTAVEEKRFREDLFYRLNVIEVRIPPLRERIADIRPIALAYARRFAMRMNKGSVRLSDAALEALEGYPWPGNVRELINVIERAVLLNQTGVIERGEFPLSREERGTTLPIRKEEGRIVIDLPSAGVALDAVEQALIVAALARAGGNITGAARLLEVGRGTLRYKMKKFGIESADAKKKLQSGSNEPVPVID